MMQLNPFFVTHFIKIVTNSLQVIKRGTPNSRPTNNELCTIKISGKLADGTTVDEDDELTFQLGDMEVLFLKIKKNWNWSTVFMLQNLSRSFKGSISLLPLWIAAKSVSLRLLPDLHTESMATGKIFQLTPPFFTQLNCSQYPKKRISKMLLLTRDSLLGTISIYFSLNFFYLNKYFMQK